MDDVTQGLRAVGVATGLSFVVGCGVGAVVLLVGEASPILPRLSIGFLVEVLAISILASGVVSIPMGVLGGLFTAVMLRRYGRAIPAPRWPFRGGVAGVVGGSLACVAYASLMSAGSLAATDMALLSFYLLIGALCGGVVGLGTGAWCARQLRASTGPDRGRQLP